MKTRFYLLIISVFVFCGMYARPRGASSLNQSTFDRQTTLDYGAETVRMPCTMLDEDDGYYASGFKRFKVAGNVPAHEEQIYIKNRLLVDLKEQVKIKIAGEYKSVVRDYSEQIDVNDKSYFALHLERAGVLLIDKYLSDMQVTCEEYDADMDGAGYKNIYMGIFIKKEDITDYIEDGIMNSTVLSQSERNALRANETAFRASISRYMK